MVLMTGDEYVRSLKRRRVKVYALGEEIADPTEHPLLKPSLNAVAETYNLAHEAGYEWLATAKSHLTGEQVNRFTHIHQNTHDLVCKVKLLRVLCERTGTCIQRCVGWDALNALYIATYEIDAKHGTSYHERIKRYLEYVQRNDLMCAGAMTDVKGDRSLRPHEQRDPDMYVRVVEKREDGIVVRGAKAHTTGCVHSHEIIALPTRAMEEKDADYAVAFAVPTDVDGVKLVVGRQMGDYRRVMEDWMDVGNYMYSSSGHETLTVFDDVFVPWERVFMCGETEFTGLVVETFSSYHRQNYGGCKAGMGDVLIGASALAALYNGIMDASHVRDKLVEMTHMNETLYSCALACSYEGYATPSGAYRPEPLLANVCKLNVTKAPYEMARLAQDIAGGIVATMPSERDLKNEKVGKYVAKYMQGNADYPAEHRMRAIRLIENLTMSTGYLVESLHGAGSPQTQKIMISRQAKFKEKMKNAARLAGINFE